MGRDGRFDPKTAGRKRTAATRIGNPKQVRMELLSAKLHEWVKMVREYEAGRGRPRA